MNPQKALKDIEKAYKRIYNEPWGFIGTLTRAQTNSGSYDPTTGTFTPASDPIIYPCTFIMTTEFLSEFFRKESSEQKGMQEEERQKHNLLIAAKGVIPRKDDILVGFRQATNQEITFQIVAVMLGAQTAAIRCYGVQKDEQ